MKRSVRCLTMLTALVGASFAHAKELPNFDAYYRAQPTPAGGPRVLRSPLGGHVTSVHPHTGAPTFFWASRDQSGTKALVASTKPDVAARKALVSAAEMLKLPEAAIQATVVREIHDRGAGGVVVRLGQEIEGIEVFRGGANVMLDRSHRLVAASNNLHPAGFAGNKRVPRTFVVTPQGALASAFRDFHGTDLPVANLLPRGEKGRYQTFDLVPTQAHEFAGPARVKKVFFPLPDRLVPAYYLEIRPREVGQKDAGLYAYVIAADDGRVLYRQNLSHDAVFNYRVWADANGDKRPLDGPQADFTPHPTGQPDNSQPDFIAPVLVSMDGFNKNPQGTFDPWLASGATSTSGNNVDAYADHAQPDGFGNGDTRPSVTAPGTFDRVYDVNLAPTANQNQIMAAATQLFYVTNWLHDYWYDSGFDEKAGNAQKSNYGRGGEEGDALRAEAQDDALNNQSRNNANMQTPADGESPIMQMYLWSGASTRSLTTNPGGTGYGTDVAEFGLQVFNTTGSLALVDDQSTTTTNETPGTFGDGCQSIKNNVTGKIVVIDRGACTFKQKAVNAQAAGAIGMILANHLNEAAPPYMPNGQPNQALNIPVLSVTLASGNAIKQAMMGGDVTATMVRSAAGVERDGTIDNHIVAHEWGHYLHNRLAYCGSNMCGGMGEGWGDTVAIHMALREGDDLDGVFGMSVYATATLGDSGYYGIRRVPYSTDMTKNGLTYRHIADDQALPDHPMAVIPAPNSEVHNAGEVWATMMFEATVALLKRSQQPGAPYDFEGARRRMADYIVASLKTVPPDATYLEQRDAILMAASTVDLKDMEILAQAFAKRGAGSCAVSPPRDSGDNIGVVESFEVKASVSDLAGGLDDTVQSCDSDGRLDAQESGRVTIELKNTGVAPLTDAVASVTAQQAGISFPNGTQVQFGTVPPFGTAKATIDVALDGSVAGISSVKLDIAVTSAETCEPKSTLVEVPYINYDNVPESAAIESAESDIETWTRSGDGADRVWNRIQNGPPNHVFHGVDSGSLSDTAYESPAIVAGPGPLTVTLKHRHEFEVGPPPQGGGTVNYDGAVIEISTDGGQSWQDAAQFAMVPYTGTITNISDNPLGNRQGFTNRNAAWPGFNTMTLNFGSSLSGKTFKLRFRIGTDPAAGAYGWEIDDIDVQGAVNKPFASIVEDSTNCVGLPVANAGADLVVSGGDEVTLDGSKSNDPDGDTLTYKWTQTEGPEVALTPNNGPKPTFVAPNTQVDVTLTFQLTISDGKGLASDLVKVTVQPGSGNGEGGGAGVGTSGSGAGGGPIIVEDEGGCGCAVVGDEQKSPVVPAAAALGLIGAVFARLRRRSRK
ncbi:M36 family metallopeptidase [Polyangium jinanense]|uniref:M36 family metallopeptidase n=1 Tax=Polyangium jinanense TaxID=2829994 RepID=A0A9X4AVY8_9BACT|nr:M36 family metallopeptidase [Polyangium jinanense]MDC3960060.1 M36 family metallopeptidase [Polyangium jinanense]MDC3986196.1 M36 family metallopeptidase [Polyangium jinanense]